MPSLPIPSNLCYTRHGFDSAADLVSVNNPDSVPNTPPARPWLFQKGQSGNPGGQPRGARRRLTTAFLNDLADDYAAHGAETLRQLRLDNPKAYISAVVKLCPRELEVSNALDDLDNDALRIVLAAAQRYMERQRAAETQLAQSQLQTLNGSSGAEPAL